MIEICTEVSDALATDGAVVALESTVLAHGLPYPRNLEVGRALEEEVRAAGAVPATIAVIAGIPRIGLSSAEMEAVATGDEVLKLSTRDLAVAIARGRNGATTVAATMWLAARAGIRVFATGGIGGVHRGEPRDASADLTELSRTPMIVVCSGAKAILDLAATREALETAGVLIVGWGTEELPAFYSARSGLPVDVTIDTPEQAAALWNAHRRIAGPGAILVCVPPPPFAALPEEEVSDQIEVALGLARERGIHGKDVTPFLLREVSRLTDGRSLDANVALLRNNAAVAGWVAAALVQP